MKSHKKLSIEIDSVRPGQEIDIQENEDGDISMNS